MKKNIFLIIFSLVAICSSCENGDAEFPDFDYQAVYFPYQYPVRTITLGEDIFDTTLDNEGKCVIFATMGGVYENGQNIIIDFQVDNSLVAGLKFINTEIPVTALPSTHYTLASNKITIPSGELSGGVEVQLTDAFFNDPKSLSNNYVIPVRMLAATSVDTILSGRGQVANPRRGISTDWAVQPKDFTFYAVKFINELEAFYLRRGQDIITGKNGNTDINRTETRGEQYVIDDEIVFLDSEARYQVSFPLSLQDSGGIDLNIVLLLNFDEDGNVTVESSNPSEYTATGSGNFVKDGEVNSWGSQDRDALYLTYQIDTDEIQINTQDTLVVRNRGVSLETFDPVLQ